MRIIVFFSECFQKGIDLRWILSQPIRRAGRGEWDTEGRLRMFESLRASSPFVLGAVRKVPGSGEASLRTGWDASSVGSGLQLTRSSAARRASEVSNAHLQLANSNASPVRCSPVSAGPPSLSPDLRSTTFRTEPEGSCLVLAAAPAAIAAVIVPGEWDQAGLHGLAHTFEETGAARG